MVKKYYPVLNVFMVRSEKFHGQYRFIRIDRYLSRSWFVAWTCQTPWHYCGSNTSIYWCISIWLSSTWWWWYRFGACIDAVSRSRKCAQNVDVSTWSTAGYTLICFLVALISDFDLKKNSFRFCCSSDHRVIRRGKKKKNLTVDWKRKTTTKSLL